MVLSSVYRCHEEEGQPPQIDPAPYRLSAVLDFNIDTKQRTEVGGQQALRLKSHHLPLTM